MNASVSNSAYASQQQSVNARTGRIERVFVRLDAVYPNSNDLSEEYSFDELRARRRGWLDKKWEPQRKENKTPKVEAEITPDNTQNDSTGEQSQQDFTVDVSSVDQTLSDVTGPRQPSREGKSSKPRKKKLVEESLPTQTSMKPRIRKVFAS